MTHELMSRSQADLFCNALMLLGLLIAVGAALRAQRRQSNVWHSVGVGLRWGTPLSVIGFLWQIYNIITDRIGLNTVANLLLNLALFVTVGAIGGVGYAKLGKQILPNENETEEP